MKEQFVALHIPTQGNQKSPSIWRRWKRLTACQKRSCIVFIFLILTTYFVGAQLHELHQRFTRIFKIPNYWQFLRSKKLETHKKSKKAKHKNDPIALTPDTEFAEPSDDLNYTNFVDNNEQNNEKSYDSEEEDLNIKTYEDETEKDDNYNAQNVAGKFQSLDKWL